MMRQRFRFNLMLSFKTPQSAYQIMRSSSFKSAASEFDVLAANVLTERGEFRPALLSALTDLFVSRDTPDGEEISRFEELALQLIPKADAGALAHVAARLARHPFAPCSVIDLLLQSDPVAATILIEHCARIAGETLATIAENGGVEEAAVLARREHIEPELVEILSERPEDEVLCALAANPYTHFDPSLQARLIARARNCDDLARLLCKRIPDSETVTPLFLAATPQQRAEILQNAEFAEFSAAQLRRVETASPMLIDWIVERARQGLWALAAQEIARITNFERATVDRMLADPQGDGLAVLLAAIGCPVEKAIRLFLACPPDISHSYHRVKALAHTVEQLPAHAAHKLAQAISGPQREAVKRGRHVPVADPRAKATPSRPLTGISTHRMPPLRTLRANIRQQR